VRDRGQLAFLDTEAITLEPGPDVLWEVGMILRGADGEDTEWRYQLAPNMDVADPRSLEISMFDQRYQVPDGLEALAWTPLDLGEGARLTHAAAAESLARLLYGRHLVGAVPSFDSERLGAYLRRFDLRPPWHYHLIDVENLCVGWLSGKFGQAVGLPWDSEEVSRACGVNPPDLGADRHTALGDARWVRDLYDAVLRDAA
jgi:hypothetical protein